MVVPHGDSPVQDQRDERADGPPSATGDGLSSPQRVLPRSELYGCALPVKRVIANVSLEEESSPKSRSAALKFHFESPDTPLIDLLQDKRAKIVEHDWNDQLTFKAAAAIPVLESKTVDLATLKAIEIGKLVPLISPPGASHFGELVALRVLLQPNTSPVVINARQDALRELQENRELRQACEHFWKQFCRREKDLFLLLNNRLSANVSYSWLRDIQGVIRGMVDGISKIPKPRSSYLKVAFDHVEALRDSLAYRLMKEGIVRTFDGLKPPSDINKDEHTWRFYPIPFYRGTFILCLPLVAFASRVFFGQRFFPIESPQVISSLAISSMFLAAGAFFHAFGSKPFVDHRTVHNPYRDLLLEDGRFSSALESISRLGELLGFLRFWEHARIPMVLPTVVNASHHFLKAKGMRSPILYKDPSFVGNDVDLGEFGLTFMTGPNSGGKSTYAQDIVLLQLLAQAGGPVPAESATVGIADKIRYQFVENGSSDNADGRFGVELERSRDIFFERSRRRLNVFDELGEGTSTSEGYEHSRRILDGMVLQEVSTILISHRHDLVKEFQERGIGQSLMVEFKDGNPTHKIVPGIATSSHSERVAQKKGFTLEHMRQHLIREGFLNTGKQ